MPAIFDETTTKFIVPNGSLQNKLFKMVLQKQLHECQNQCIQKGWNGIYKFGFPFASHIEPNFFYSKEKINGNIIDHNMKIEMSFHIIQHCYYYGVLIWIFYILHFLIGHFIY